MKATLDSYITLLKHLFLPDERADSILDLDLEALYNQGIRTLLLDVDNTLLTYDDILLNLDHLNWVHRAKAIGFKLFLLSNNSSKRRIRRVAKQTQLTGLYFSCKPFPFAVRHLLSDHKIDPQTCAVIGDQLFTDIVLANWIRAYGILVEPISKKRSFIRTLQKDIEAYLLDKLDATHL